MKWIFDDNLGKISIFLQKTCYVFTLESARPDNSTKYPQVTTTYVFSWRTEDNHALIVPRHEKTCLMLYANNKGADQPAHPHSLIGAFVVRCLDSMIPILAQSKISRL